jgi:hypothetical protein
MNTDHQKSRMVPELLLEASRRPRNQQHTARYQQTHSYCCAAAAALLLLRYCAESYMRQ